jgi:two-component system, NtrC family, sensor kinase
MDKPGRARGRGNILRSPWMGAAVLLVLVVGLVCALLLRAIYVRELTQGEERAAEMALLLEEQTLRHFQAADLVLQHVRDTLLLTEVAHDDPDFRRSLIARLDYLPHVRALFVIGPDGFIIHDTDYPDTPRVSLADRAYFILHQRNPDIGLHIGTPLISRSLYRPFVSVSRRIDSEGQFAGVVVAAVEPVFYEQFYADLQLGAQDSIGLYHRENALIARVPEDLGLLNQPVSALGPLLDRSRRAEAGTFTSKSPLDGERRAFSYRVVEGMPLIISVALSVDALLAPVRETALLGGLGFLSFAALMLSGTAMLLARHAERREQEQHARQTQRLSTIGEMTGGIAHDFRNVLAVVSSGLRLIEKADQDQEKRELYIRSIEEALKRGERITSALLHFARAHELQITKADINHLLRQLGPVLAHAAGTGISLDMKLQAGPGLCRVDTSHFDMIILNLVLNARDAIEGAGRIEILTSDWHEPGSSLVLEPGPYVRVRVRDNGQGMDEEVSRRAIEPFFSTKGERGTGLGLSQVYGVVRQLGGDVRISSRPGQGTTVDLLLPSVPGTPDA